jgi:formylglycine-generating enzyme required for sulfatase activity
MSDIHGDAMTIIELDLPPGASPLQLRWVAPGMFWMGVSQEVMDASLEDGPPFQARLTRGYWLGQFPVTQAQWIAVMGANPSQFTQEGMNRPVDSVSWVMALEFCAQLTQHIPSRWPSGYGFSLPTEVQWEYAACAGGIVSPTHHVADAKVDRVAWYRANSGGQTHPVGHKAPNAWGFYDMQGNVYEWCYDACDGYPSEITDDRVGTSDSFQKVFRGGAFGSPNNGSLDIPSRGFAVPTWAKPWMGFRLCIRYLGTA